MTSEQFLERIEHVTAGIAEERRKDREESRQLWRDTQRQIHEIADNLYNLTLKVADTNDAIARLAKESREADARLEARIDAVVSAIGQLLPAKNQGSPKREARLRVSRDPKGHSHLD